jgi:hypothetical protein
MRFEQFMPRMRCKATVMALVSSTLALVSQLNAEPFIYTGRDLLLGFRQADGVSEMVVNLGQASNYLNAAQGSVITISNFTPAQLQAAFSTVNGLLWSVAGTTRSGDGGDTSIPNATLWMSRARLVAATQTAPWLRKSAFSQGGAANKVNEFGVNTGFFSDSLPADPIRNTRTSVIEPTGDLASYGVAIGDQGNLKGNFQGNIENNTGVSFTEPVRSDLYEMRPGSGDLPGRYLGYFELRPDGTMIFQAPSNTPPPAPPRPNIESIARIGTMTTISFTTTNDATVIYRLRSTNSAGLDAPLSTWATSTATVTGNGQVRTLQDDSSDSDRFYSISASR